MTVRFSMRFSAACSSVRTSRRCTYTPGVYVQRVVALSPEQAADKRIEKTTTRPRPGAPSEALVDDAATHGLGG